MDTHVETHLLSDNIIAIMDKITNMIKPINIENYLDCLLTKINDTANILTIVSTIIGSHVYIPIDAQLDTVLSHEFPMLVEKLFTDPTKQFTLDMYNHLRNVNDFHMSQVMFLIDPIYQRNAHPLQFIQKMCSILSSNGDNFEMDQSTGKFIMHRRKQISDTHHVTIHSYLEVFIIRDNISIDRIYNAIEIVNTFSRYNPVIMNIMDCSSTVILPIYIHNKSSRIFVTEPSCAFKDSNPENVPVIELVKCGVIRNIGDSRDAGDIIERRFCARWVNLTDDTEYLPTWRIISDSCEQTHIAHTFLTNLMLHRYINIDLIGAYKLWYLFNLNIEYEYPSHIDPTIIKKIVFKNIDYMLFSELVKDRKFIDYIIYRSGVYHKEHTIYMIQNYKNVIKTNQYLQFGEFTNMNFVMKQLVLDILKMLSINIPGTIGYYEDEMIDLKFLKVFFESRQIHF